MSLLAITLGATPFHAAHAAEKRAANPTAKAAAYVLPDAETWELTSKEGARYQILVSRPSAIKPPSNGYPVLYVLDGNAFFASFADARRVQEVVSAPVANTLIVAVGYPAAKDGPYDFERRMEDFTPPWQDPMPNSEKPFANYKVGGQDRLLSFLVEQLRPELAKRYPIDPHQQALFGHSLGGLFALHVLYKRPEAFSALIAASPTVYWNNSSILAEEREFAEKLAQSKIRPPIARVLLVAGEREETPPELLDLQPLAQRLAPLSAYGLRSYMEIFKDETHVTVPSRSVTTALRFAFTWP